MKLKYFLSLTVLANVLPAAAQYQWIDANGRKVYSDQPPPASVPAKKSGATTQKYNRSRQPRNYQASRCGYALRCEI
ncbi:MAG: DUF4124 domain-containing protein [Polaromonas sp.]|nr:DUF4124 domain-containing protein [Polaromonas sp.]